MSMEEDIRQLVLDVDGVARVYSADPLWKSVARQLGALLGPGEAPAEEPFVDCRLEGATLTVRIRVGTDGSVPAPALARTVAAAIRSFVVGQSPDSEVVAAVEIAAIGV